MYVWILCRVFYLRGRFSGKYGDDDGGGGGCGMDFMGESVCVQRESGVNRVL